MFNEKYIFKSFIDICFETFKSNSLYIVVLFEVVYASERFYLKGFSYK